MKYDIGDIVLLNDHRFSGIYKNKIAIIQEIEDIEEDDIRTYGMIVCGHPEMKHYFFIDSIGQLIYKSEQ